MILLDLFLSFLEVGAFSFGGGYGMVSLIRDLVTERGWLTANEFLDFVAVAESTPGPLAVNMATFVGASQAGFSGALVATIGVVLPSFLIILLISALLNNLLKFAGVQAFLRGVRPAVTGLICATAVTMLLEVVFGVQAIGKLAPQDVRPIAIFALLSLFTFVVFLWKKKTPSPIAIILISAALGIAVYSLT